MKPPSAEIFEAPRLARNLEGISREDRSCAPKTAHSLTVESSTMGDADMTIRPLVKLVSELSLLAFLSGACTEPGPEWGRGSLEGYVTDSDGNGVAGVLMTCAPSSGEVVSSVGGCSHQVVEVEPIETHTNASGFYRFGDLTTGRLETATYLAGPVGHSVEVVIQENQTATQDFILQE
jgi:hypothetical protein